MGKGSLRICYSICPHDLIASSDPEMKTELICPEVTLEININKE